MDNLDWLRKKEESLRHEKLVILRNETSSLQDMYAPAGKLAMGRNTQRLDRQQGRSEVAQPYVSAFGRGAIHFRTLRASLEKK